MKKNYTEDDIKELQSDIKALIELCQTYKKEAAGAEEKVSKAKNLGLNSSFLESAYDDLFYVRITAGCDLDYFVDKYKKTEGGF